MSTSDDKSQIWCWVIRSDWSNLYPFWPAFCYCSVLKTAIELKRDCFENPTPVFSLQPCRRKGPNWPLNFSILGAISYCHAGFPQGRVVAETLSMVCKICCRSVQFTSFDGVFRWLRSSSRACEPSHPDSVGMCCLQTTQHQHIDIWAIRVDSSRAISIIGVLLVVDYISQ